MKRTWFSYVFVLLFACLPTATYAGGFSVGIPGVVTIDSGGNVKTGDEAEVCAPGVCVGTNGVKVQSVDETIHNIIEADPVLRFLPDKEKEKLSEVIKTTGFVSVAMSDPITGLIVLHVLQGDQAQDIPVQEVDAPDTGKVWMFQVDCIVLQEGNLVSGYINGDPPGLVEAKEGDKVQMVAPVCPVYKEKSVTSVTMRMTGKADFPNAVPPRYRHIILGRT